MKNEEELDFGDLDFGLDEKKEVLGDGGAGANKQISELLKGFLERKKEEDRRLVDALDSEFWFAVCFQNREQKKTFLEALKWMRHGDKYLDGLELAEEMKIALPPSRPAKKVKISERWKKLAFPMDK